MNVSILDRVPRLSAATLYIRFAKLRYYKRAMRPQMNAFCAPIVLSLNMDRRWPDTGLSRNIFTP